MCELKICRICLRTKAKMYEFNRLELKCYYEEVMALKVNEHDGLPQCFCYQCAEMLHKFHKFKEKCYSGQKTLKEILWRGPITYDAVCKVDRDSSNLQSPLEIMTCNKNVQTYIFKHKSLNKLIKKSCSIKNKRKKITVVKHGSAVENNKNFPILSTILNTGNLLNDPVGDIDNEKICTGDQHVSDTEKTPINLTTVLMDLDDENNVAIKQISSSSNLAGTKEDGLKMSLDVEDIPTSLTTVFVADSDQNMNFNEQISTVISDDDTNHIPSDNEEIAAKPTVEFEDENNETVNLNIEPITINSTKIFVEELTLDKKGIKEKQSEEGRFQRNKKKRFLDMKHWEKYSLNEEEAWQEFRTRAEHRTYVQAHYSCKDCLKGFSQEDMLKRHLQRRHHESAGKIQCRFCHIRFKRMHELRRHLEEHLIKYKCLRCNVYCKKKFAAIYHDKSHSGFTQQCTLCGLEFRHLSTYYTHMRTHRSEHVCALCGASFVSALGLHNHKKVKHLIEDEKPKGENVDKDANTFCEKCNIRFESQTAYDMHLLHSNMHVGEDPRTVEPSLKPSKSRRRKKHIITKKSLCYSQRYLCEICGASLAPGSVPMHENLHSREVLHTCDTCGRQFHTTVGLKRHLVTHTGEKPYPCPLCEKRFTQNNSMKLHYRTFHLKQPYPKRNRNKKLGGSEDTSLIAEYYQNKEDVDDMPLEKWRTLRS